MSLCYHPSHVIVSHCLVLCIYLSACVRSPLPTRVVLSSPALITFTFNYLNKWGTGLQACLPQQPHRPPAQTPSPAPLLLLYAILYNTILYYTILYYTILYYTIQHYTIPSHAVEYYTILFYSIRHSAIKCYCKLYYTLQYCVRPHCYAILH